MTPSPTSSLCEILARIDSPESMQAALVDLCTPQELRALAERWRVAEMLDRDLSYREISAQTGVSTTTIGRVARFLREEPHGGYRLMLELDKTDD